ncbi:unnamed protein product [Prunus armeniaca]
MLVKPGFAVPAKIRESTRFYPYFKDCIGAIDGTHISAMNESSSSSSLPVNEGDPELVFQTQEQQRAHANEWRVGIALNMWRDIGHNDNNDNE